MRCARPFSGDMHARRGNSRRELHEAEHQVRAGGGAAVTHALPGSHTHTSSTAPCLPALSHIDVVVCNGAGVGAVPHDVPIHTEHGLPSYRTSLLGLSGRNDLTRGHRGPAGQSPPSFPAPDNASEQSVTHRRQRLTQRPTDGAVPSACPRQRRFGTTHYHLANAPVQNV